MKSLGSFSISPEESQAFARISGDFNPLHLDSVAARRTQFGQTLIHGVLGTLKALDLWLGDAAGPATLASLKVKYSKPATQGQELAVSAETSGEVTRLEVFAEGARCQIIDVEAFLTPAGNASQPSEPFAGACSENSVTCLDRSIADCADLEDTVDLIWDSEIVAALLPNAGRLLQPAQLATILASTQIVGMKCPGLHSVFAQLQLRFSATAGPAEPGHHTQLGYQVLKADARINQVQLGLKNAYAEGGLEAFFRSPPAQQASFEEIAGLVSPGEFSNQNALVIGGSRGLGEVIAKVLAAGDANILMTYASGKDDAVSVAKEIAALRPAPAVCHYNVLDSSMDRQMAAFCASVSHIYYLASPAIAKGEGNKWDGNLFSRYSAFYIDGLAALLQRVNQLTSRDTEIQLFIPSSVFLDETSGKIKGFDEYIVAKAAAETYVQRFEKAHRNWRVAAPRLPRLHTDQTSGVRGLDEQETLKVIIEQLRQEFSQAEA